MNSALPTGGVTRPIHRLKIMMIPKCSGSTPIWVTIGRKIGVKISTAGVISIKIPTSSRIMLIISIITMGFSEMASKASLIRYGRSALVIAQDMATDTEISSNTIEDVTTDSRITDGSSLILISLGCGLFATTKPC